MSQCLASENRSLSAIKRVESHATAVAPTYSVPPTNHQDLRDIGPLYGVHEIIGTANGLQAQILVGAGAEDLVQLITMDFGTLDRERPAEVKDMMGESAYDNALHLSKVRIGDGRIVFAGHFVNDFGTSQRAALVEGYPVPLQSDMCLSNTYSASSEEPRTDTLISEPDPFMTESGQSYLEDQLQHTATDCWRSPIKVTTEIETEIEIRAPPPSPAVTACRLTED
jgi:hypothetical protein